MVARSRSNPLALAVLSCLYERPMHPYEVAQTLRFRAKHESVRLNYGSLYSLVEALEGKGLIRARETVRDGRRPERTVYEITDAGEVELVDWLSDLVATPTKEYLQFEAALSFIAVLPPEDAASLLTQRAQALEILLAQHRGLHHGAEAQGLPRLFLLEDEFMGCLLEAELDWVRKLIKDIETGALDGLDGWKAWSPDGIDGWKARIAADPPDGVEP
jgi:DNA-binding PadR family transcriptional regulator